MPLGINRLPDGPTSLWEFVRKLRKDFDEFRAARRLEAASIGSGGLEIVDGGTFTMRTPSGQSVVYVGPVDWTHLDGSTQQGMVFRREDGTQAFGIYAQPSIQGTDTQAWTWWDRSGHIVFSEDTTSGIGLARPYLPLPVPTAEDITTWPKTTATTWTTIARSRGIIQHPRLHISATMSADAGTTGQIQLLVDGNVVATGAVGAILDATVSVPNYSYLMDSEFQLQAQRTSGTGAVYGMTRYLYGVQS